jgi:hypothetical protein
VSRDRVIRVCLLLGAGPPGVEADHSAGHAAVGVLLPVRRGGGVAGEVGAGEFAECLVQEAGQLAGRGRDVLAGQVQAKGPPQVGVTAQAPRLRSGSNRVDTRSSPVMGESRIAASRGRALPALRPSRRGASG